MDKSKPMSVAELEEFLEEQGLTDQDFVELIGVTRPALDHWLRGRRAIPATTAKLVRFFSKHPKFMAEF